MRHSAEIINHNDYHESLLTYFSPSGRDILVECTFCPCCLDPSISAGKAILLENRLTDQ